MSANGNPFWTLCKFATFIYVLELTARHRIDGGPNSGLPRHRVDPRKI
jgi:hypothetical protein